MPKVKKRKLVQSEKKRRGNANQLRDKEGKYTTLKNQKQHKELLVSRSIKVVKEKGSYGTYIIKQRFIPDDIRNIIILSIVVGLMIGIL